MLVLQRVLLLWKEQGHRALVFSQTQQMLDILEALCCKLGFTYRRMDGCTAVGARMVRDDDHVLKISVVVICVSIGSTGC